ncbi:PRELI domain-containing protein 2-like [Megalops cyprinoides]|uniref:PRELI domain-containing protein 2-like n=1 Tax=Megalops cyprinoides TaxID=118141 RepID=UPI0018640ACD|nr:PRELI domain-containing protein 2-like [Megalops cyprinoides]
MVITVETRKMYRYPFERVVDIHLNKYPTPLEEHVRGIKTVEEKKDNVSGIIYRKRIATCNNVLPSILRKVHVMNVDDIYMEEESWLDVKRRTMNIKSRCLTWTQYGTLQEVSSFRESAANPNWTEFLQSGSVTVTGVGRLNRLFELFAQSFFSKGIKKSVTIMEKILEQRYGCPCS